MACLPAPRPPESRRGVPWPTLDTETQIPNICCVIRAGGGTLNVPFCRNELSRPWQCPLVGQQRGS